ncbi:MAG TPA: SDR family oxidoreductase [Candidatus Udaeobacter sp.]|jgi:NAD(P)-dependent dehydrogenase (short-subunit alcohol dehydrogenase family)
MNSRLVIGAGTLLVGAWITARAVRTALYTLRDKVVLITGGSRGLGLVLARHICAQHGNVALIARDREELARAKADLVRRGGKVLTVECDLLEPTQIQSAVRQIIDRFGKIDILINNAGIIEVGPLEHMSHKDFERAMRLHFWAPYELISQVVPEMRLWGGGRIVNISSIGGKVAVPHMASYSASKFALTGLSDALRSELARDGIYVTTVAPGMMRTGSHVNAEFKGKHNQEFAWFAASAGAPFISMNANRAARKILSACRRGQPSLTLTFAARGAIVANALFPNLTGYAMKIVNRFLPDAGDEMGSQSRAGSQIRRLTPQWMTRLADRATTKNNERKSQAV